MSATGLPAAAPPESGQAGTLPGTGGARNGVGSSSAAPSDTGGLATGTPGTSDSGGTGVGNDDPVTGGGGQGPTIGEQSSTGAGTGGSPNIAATAEPTLGEGSTSTGENSNSDTQDDGVSEPKYPNAVCAELVTNPTINWRESSLRTDQEIVQCLAETLGRPVGYGERALGGYDPGGNSRLVVITPDDDVSVEAQVAAAIAGDDPTWIVFDKEAFAQPYEVAMYRQHCDDGSVLNHLQATSSECRDYRAWCASRGHEDERECLERFFNVALNDDGLPIRNPMIGSNKTIDGRMAQAYFRFSGFAIGADSSGAPSSTSRSVILTHLNFVGAGHTEDHELDPDMIRVTGASHDVWIHKNDFDLTGDSAFDVKVGAYDITVSFNRVMDVKRATLHGSSDSREINAQITTTLHHNAFITRDEMYDVLGNTGRRVPLIRRGKSHLWNNVFFNYRKDILSVRVGASVLWEQNAVLINEAHQEKSSVEASLSELSGNLLRDVDDGNFRSTGSYLWFSDAACTIDPSTRTSLEAQAGTVADLGAQYPEPSRRVLSQVRQEAGQALIDYVLATAGSRGVRPFNSPLAPSIEAVVAEDAGSCQAW